MDVLLFHLCEMVKVSHADVVAEDGDVKVCKFLVVDTFKSLGWEIFAEVIDDNSCFYCLAFDFDFLKFPGNIVQLFKTARNQHNVKTKTSKVERLSFTYSLCASSAYSPWAFTIPLCAC